MITPPLMAISRQVAPLVKPMPTIPKRNQTLTIAPLQTLHCFACFITKQYLKIIAANASELIYCSSQ